MSVSQVIVDLCQVGQYQTGEHQQRQRQIQTQTQIRTNFKVFSTSFSEYLRHAPCMRQAQAEYESCADQYQLRIKTLNKVMVVMSTQCQHHDNDNNAFEEDGERDNCEYNDIMMS